MEFLPDNLSSVFFQCVEESQDAVMITDRTGKIVYINRAWTKIYGYTKEEALGLTPKLLHSGQHDSQFYKTMWASILDPLKGVTDHIMLTGKSLLFQQSFDHHQNLLA